MAKVISIDELLSYNLNIPQYQRPYKWSNQNMQDLLSDIINAISDSERYRGNFKYRIGTIILHESETDKGVLEIVDGQQRIISLTLLRKYLDPNLECNILKLNFANRITQSNIKSNYRFIKDWFSLKDDETKKKFLDAYKDILQVVVLSVNKVSEAFQLFDSQNARGKELDPHDLLKAYHLREMKKYPYEMNHAVTKWEAKDTKKIRDLFDLYLFPIWNWSRGNKTKQFTTKEIDTYKGIQENSYYSYARRASKATPYYQITEPFVAGNDFFEMVEHYLEMLNDIHTEIKDKFKDLYSILKNGDKSAGFGYSKNLFYCALMAYYDKFHNFDEMAVKRLFTWAFMIRVDMENLGYDSINKYAIGEWNGYYSNNIAMFTKIGFARLHTEISNQRIELRDDGHARVDKWNDLYEQIKKINGIGG